MQIPDDNMPPEIRLVNEPLPQEVLDSLRYLNEMDKAVHECAESWPDETLDTPDGRHFRILYDGSTIFSRSTKLSRKDRTKLNKMAGAIVELHSNEKPMYFTEAVERDKMWNLLQQTFGVVSSISKDDLDGDSDEETEDGLPK